MGEGAVNERGLAKCTMQRRAHASFVPTSRSAWARCCSVQRGSGSAIGPHLCPPYTNLPSPEPALKHSPQRHRVIAESLAALADMAEARPREMIGHGRNALRG